MATVSYPHIELSADGVPSLEGTRTKVVEIALDAVIAQQLAEIDRIAGQQPPSLLREKLKRNCGSPSARRSTISS